MGCGSSGNLRESLCRACSPRPQPEARRNTPSKTKGSQWLPAPRSPAQTLPNPEADHPPPGGAAPPAPSVPGKAASSEQGQSRGGLWTRPGCSAWTPRSRPPGQGGVPHRAGPQVGPQNTGDSPPSVPFQQHLPFSRHLPGQPAGRGGAGPSCVQAVSPGERRENASRWPAVLGTGASGPGLGRRQREWAPVRPTQSSSTYRSMRS